MRLNYEKYGTHVLMACKLSLTSGAEALSHSCKALDLKYTEIAIILQTYFIFSSFFKTKTFSILSHSSLKWP